MNRRAMGWIGAVLTSLIALVWWRSAADPTRSTQISAATPASATAHQVTAVAGTSAPPASSGVPAGLAAETPESIVSWLLTAPATQVTRRTAQDRWEALVRGASETQRVAESLTGSADPVERWLGYRLLLELDGATTGLLERARTESSALVASEIAGALYRQRAFDKWDRWIDGWLSSILASTRLTLLESLDPSVALVEGPSALMLLGLGAELPALARQVVRRQPSVVEASATSSLQKALGRVLEQVHTSEVELEAVTTALRGAMDAASLQTNPWLAVFVERAALAAVRVDPVLARAADEALGALGARDIYGERLRSDAAYVRWRSEQAP